MSNEIESRKKYIDQIQKKIDKLKKYLLVLFITFNFYFVGSTAYLLENSENNHKSFIVNIYILILVIALFIMDRISKYKVLKKINTKK